MIHVQIASQLTHDGVNGVRWVLVEAGDAASVAQTPEPEPTSAVTPSDPAPAATPVADGARLMAQKAAVVALGLGAALWTAAVQVGPPGQAAAQAAPTGLPVPAVLSKPALPSGVSPRHTAPEPVLEPEARPAAPPAVSPPAPASAHPSRLTASL